MLGNVFSPYYAAARRKRSTSPLDFVAMNAVVYGPEARWALTERAGALRSGSDLLIGNSSMRWEGDSLVVDIDERAAPIPRPLRGRIRFHPSSLDGRARALDAGGIHRWHPIAPSGEVEVDLSEPRISFRGTGYLDANRGDAPLEETFSSWSWYRIAGRPGAAISYRTRERDGRLGAIDVELDRGRLRDRDLVSSHDLGPTRWGLSRTCAAAERERVVLTRTLEDTPFYARSQIEVVRDKERLAGVHETLSLDRFAKRWVQLLLPARMRRG